MSEPASEKFSPRSEVGQSPQPESGEWRRRPTEFALSSNVSEVPTAVLERPATPLSEQAQNRTHPAAVREPGQPRPHGTAPRTGEQARNSGDTPQRSRNPLRIFGGQHATSGNEGVSIVVQRALAKAAHASRVAR